MRTRRRPTYTGLPHDGNQGTMRMTDPTKSGGSSDTIREVGGKITQYDVLPGITSTKQPERSR